MGPRVFAEPRAGGRAAQGSALWIREEGCRLSLTLAACLRERLMGEFIIQGDPLRVWCLLKGPHKELGLQSQEGGESEPSGSLEAVPSPTLGFWRVCRGWDDDLRQAHQRLGGSPQQCEPIGWPRGTVASGLGASLIWPCLAPTD